MLSVCKTSVSFTSVTRKSFKCILQEEFWSVPSDTGGTVCYVPSSSAQVEGVRCLEQIGGKKLYHVILVCTIGCVDDRGGKAGFFFASLTPEQRVSADSRDPLTTKTWCAFIPSG